MQGNRASQEKIIPLLSDKHNCQRFNISCKICNSLDILIKKTSEKNTTESPKEKRRRLNRANVQRWRERQSQEKLERLRQEAAKRMSRKRANENPLQSQARRLADSQSHARRRKAETKQQREARRAADVVAHRMARERKRDFTSLSSSQIVENRNTAGEFTQETINGINKDQKQNDQYDNDIENKHFSMINLNGASCPQKHKRATVYDVNDYNDEVSESENRQCSGCGTILSNGERLMEHLQSSHSFEFELMEGIKKTLILMKKLECVFSRIIPQCREIEKINLSSACSHQNIEPSMEGKETEGMKIFSSAHDSKYECLSCGLILTSESFLKSHTDFKHHNESKEKIEIFDFKDEKDVKCPICSEYFTLVTLTIHIKFEHIAYNKIVYRCDDCRLMFRTDKHLLKHYRNFNKVKNKLFNETLNECYNGDECGKSENDVRNHITANLPIVEVKNAVHTAASDANDFECFNNSDRSVDEKLSEKENNFKCKCCSYETKHKFLILKHFLLQHNPFECPLECPFCDNKSKRKDALRKHLKISHPDTSNSTRFVCDYCGHTSFNKTNFNAHVRKHVQIFKCEYCEYTTRLPSSILVHKRRHTQQKPYKCDYDGCDYRCIQKTALTIHQYTHNPEKYSQCCSVCGFKTVNKYIMNTHMKDHKTGQDVYSCVQCSYTTNIKINLKNHSSVHREAMQCVRCDFTTKYNQTMRKHMKMKHGVATVLKRPRKSTTVIF